MSGTDGAVADVRPGVEGSAARAGGETTEPETPSAPTRVVRWIDAQQQRRRWLAFCVAVAKKFGDDTGSDLAALVAYYLFFSIFPLLLVFTTVLGFVLGAHPDLQEKLLDSALESFPVVGDQIRANIGTASGNGVALVVGLLITLWGGMGAIGSMQNAMNAVWDVPRRERPGFLPQRLRSLALLVAFVVFVVLSTVAGGLAGAASSWPVFGRLGAVVPGLVVNVALYVFAFMILTSRPVGWRAVWPGALLAGACFTAVQILGSAYVNHVVAGAGPVYGSFAIVLGLLSLLYLLAQISLLCAEVNVVRELDLWPRSLTEPRTSAEERALERAAGTSGPPTTAV
jgi:inner membrane protein YhjD